MITIDEGGSRGRGSESFPLPPSVQRSIVGEVEVVASGHIPLTLCELLLDETTVGLVIDRSEEGTLDSRSVRIGRGPRPGPPISRAFILISATAAPTKKPEPIE